MDRRQFMGVVGAGLAATSMARPARGAGSGMFRSMNAGTIGVKGTFEEQLKYAKLGGFQGLDGGLDSLAKLARDMGVAELKARYVDADIRPGGMGLPRAWRGSDAEFQAFVDQLPALAKIAAEAGVSGVATWISPTSDSMRFEENFRYHVARLRPIASALKDHGLRLGLEPVGPRTSRERGGYGFIYTIYGILGLAEAIGTGNVGLLLDSWHWYTGLATAADLKSLTAANVVHVHISDAPAGVAIEDQVDNVRALPGETGVIDLKTFLQSLDAMGYSGAVTPEPFSARLRAMDSQTAAKTAGVALLKVWKAAGLSKN